MSEAMIAAQVAQDSGEPKPGDEFGRQFMRTFRQLRLLIALVGFTLPFVLAIGGWVRDGQPLGDSMSAYYHTRLDPAQRPKAEASTVADGQTLETIYTKVYGDGVMRDWFVGSLCAIGVLLIAYRGYTKSENLALNMAGLCAFGVAMWPKSWDFPKEEGFTFSRHYVCAVLLFLFIAYVCIWEAPRTLKLIADPARQSRYKWGYRILGNLMWVSPLIAWVVTAVSRQHGSYTFFLEAVPIAIFSAYWVTKSRELRQTQADFDAAVGKLRMARASDPAGTEPLAGYVVKDSGVV